MGVRFPSEAERSVAEAQPAIRAARISAEQETQGAERARSQQARTVEQQAGNAQAPERRNQPTAAERTVRDAGGQTPGSIIDILA